jgi:hypothetical protein
MERIDVALTSREALARELPRVWWRKVGAQVIKAIKTKLKQPNRKLINHNSRLRSTLVRSEPVNSLGVGMLP